MFSEANGNIAIIDKDTYQNVVYHLASKLSISFDESRGYVHEAICNIKCFDDVANKGGYLYRSAYHEFIDDRRRREREILIDDFSYFAVPDEKQIQDYSLDINRVREVLSDMHFRMFEYFTEGFTLREVAKLEGVKYVTVRTRKHRLIAKLNKFVNIKTNHH